MGFCSCGEAIFAATAQEMVSDCGYYYSKIFEKIITENRIAKKVEESFLKKYKMI